MYFVILRKALSAFSTAFFGSGFGVYKLKALGVLSHDGPIFTLPLRALVLVAKMPCANPPLCPHACGYAAGNSCTCEIGTAICFDC